jgi:glycine oxidase
VTVAIVGGGIIGLSIAWRLQQSRIPFQVYESGPANGAATVAAGMLAPAGEARFGEEALQTLLLRSARRWESFAAELSAAGGTDVGYRTEGTLLVALTDDDLAELKRLYEYYSRAGERLEPLSGKQLRDREPMLSPRIRGGAYAPGDRQVDPRKVLEALRGLLPAPVPGLVEDLNSLPEELIVVAAGVGSAKLTGLPVRPVKGQLVRLRSRTPLLSHVIRGSAYGRPVYLVPRADGELVVGATEEERGDDRTVTAGGLLDLLRPAADLVPGVTELPVTETIAGLRPGTPDNAPIIGRLPDGTVVATGHYRNGVLLAPITADAVTALVANQSKDMNLEEFAPERFAGPR